MKIEIGMSREKAAGRPLFFASESGWMRACRLEFVVIIGINRREIYFDINHESRYISASLENRICRDGY